MAGAAQILSRYFLAVVAIFCLSSDALHAGFCWGYSQFNPTTNPLVSGNPMPWDTTCADGFDVPSIAPSDQLIRETHRNWHCTNGGVLGAPIATEAYGRGFLAFHRQFILDFNNWRVANTTLGRLEIWDPAENSLVPGNSETTTDDPTTPEDETAFTHCSIAANERPTADCGAGVCDVPAASSGIGTCVGGAKAGQACAVCKECVNLPITYIGANLDGFNTLGELGYNLDTGPNAWHGTYHNGVQVLGCSDIGGFVNTSRDPAFWMAHSKLDEIAREWQTRQATDVVIVLDRSGSMDDNCSSTNPPLSESPCAISDAKSAALTFANAVLDVRMEGGVAAAQQHRIGLASFSDTGSTAIGLTSPVDIVSDDFIVNTPFETALDGISTGGSTSIAAGIRTAISILNAAPGGPNPHQSILVLTDGKENVPPCLEGATSPCVSGDVLTMAEVGDIQIIGIGFGPGAIEDNLRDVAERHGGIYVAEANIDDPLSLQKFFVTASGAIYDAPVSIDPRGTLQPGQMHSETFEIPMCNDQRLSVVLNYQEPKRDRSRQCELEFELYTPSGQRVDRAARGVEAGHGPRHDFVHVALPYEGESKGTWTGRVVRSKANEERCPAQDFAYSVLVRGFGRVQPFVVRPDVVVGRQILATFRIAESNRPKGDFDKVEAELFLTPPQGPTKTYRLYDDGTHGDRLAGNNIWSVEIPEPATQAGAWHLRGRFALTNGGCTRIRESEYSLVVNREPKTNTTLTCSDVITGQPGETFPLDNPICIWNKSAKSNRYGLKIRDSENWLRTALKGKAESLAEVPSLIESDQVEAFGSRCFGRGEGQGHHTMGVPVVVSIPQSAGIGESSRVSVEVTSEAYRRDKPLRCDLTIMVAPPPDCNQNEVDDAIDIAKGLAQDMNSDGVPDECQTHPHFHAIRKGSETH